MALQNVETARYEKEGQHKIQSIETAANSERKMTTAKKVIQKRARELCLAISSIFLTLCLSFFDFWGVLETECIDELDFVSSVLLWLWSPACDRSPVSLYFVTSFSPLWSEFNQSNFPNLCATSGLPSLNSASRNAETTKEKQGSVEQLKTWKWMTTFQQNYTTRSFRC